jgi:hypothetical protein
MRLKKKSFYKNSKSTIRILMLKVELAVTTARKRRMMTAKVVKKLGAKLSE